MEAKNEYKVLDCECYSPEHRLIISKDEDYEDLITIQVILNHEESFFKRIKLAFKYVFGIKTGYSAMFEETIVDKNDFIKKLEEL